MSNRPRRSVRRQIAPFAPLEIAGSAAKASEISLEIAETMTAIYGPRTETAERYLAAASYVDACYLRALKRRGCMILLAPSLPAAYTSPIADLRRGHPLDDAGRAEIELLFGEGSGVIGVYERTLDAVVLPTIETAGDCEHMILHELGHALTRRHISGESRPELFEGLPWEIEASLRDPQYSSDPSRQVSEVMAEAFVWLVVGRLHELPPAVVSELVGILPLDAEPPPIDLL